MQVTSRGHSHSRGSLDPVGKDKNEEVIFVMIILIPTKIFIKYTFSIIYMCDVEPVYHCVAAKVPAGA